MKFSIWVHFDSAITRISVLFVTCQVDSELESVLTLLSYVVAVAMSILKSFSETHSLTESLTRRQKIVFSIKTRVVFGKILLPKLRGVRTSNFRTAKTSNNHFVWKSLSINIMVCWKETNYCRNYHCHIQK